MTFTLTFDDGPSEWTDPILDLLAKHNHRAMFFVTGENADSVDGRARVAREFADGHVVGVHGWSHRRLTLLTRAEIRAELADTASLLESVTLDKPSLFRPPFFARDDRVVEIAFDLGMHYCGASLTPDDWMAIDAKALAQRVLGGLVDGSIVSLHDGIPPDGGSSSCTDSRAVTVEAVRLILEAKS